MIVLGIDPGYALMGWGVVESEGSRMKLINYGCIETKAGVPMQDRLRTLQLGPLRGGCRAGPAAERAARDYQQGQL